LQRFRQLGPQGLIHGQLLAADVQRHIPIGPVKRDAASDADGRGSIPAGQRIDVQLAIHHADRPGWYCRRLLTRVLLLVAKVYVLGRPATLDRDAALPIQYHPEITI